MLDEVERSLHDSLCVTKRVLESGSVVIGGGACEIALFTKLEDFTLEVSPREQMAVQEFAEALLVIPKTLALNAALDSIELLSMLKAIHNKA